MANEAVHYESVSDPGFKGRHRITVEQIGQNHATNKSTVRVNGYLHNDNDFRVAHYTPDIERHIGGHAEFSYPDFSFDIDGHDLFRYIGHDFVLEHSAGGWLTVDFHVHYGLTDTPTFNGNQTCTVSLVLDRIPKRPDPPGTPTLSNITPTSCRVSWTASPDDMGSEITTYRLRRWSGADIYGPYVDSSANNLARNITGLVPGVNYTFAVYAHNGSADNGGWSNPSGFAYIVTTGYVWIRVGGQWKKALPFVRSGGIWKEARPYIRSGGTWHETG